MPESKFAPKGYKSALKTFTDRVEPVTIFNQHLSDIVNEKKKKIALVFYGVGGVGKTRLISELIGKLDRNAIDKEIQDKKKIEIVHISMDIHEFDSPTSALIGIRKQVKSPCILFDYALARYLSIIGKTTDQIKEFIPRNSVWWDVLGEVLSVIHIPLGLVDRIVIWAREKHSEQFNLYQDEIREIEDLIHDPNSIAERLPHFLGLDLSVISRTKNESFVVFLDSFESIYKRKNYVEGNIHPDEFIRELLVSSENTLFVIGSREFLKWNEIDPEWNDVLDQHILEYLSPEDSEYFLRQVPITDDKIIKSIVSTCKGLPLYLDLCVEIYKKKSSNSLNPNDFLIPAKEIIIRFLNHMPDSEKDLISALSYLHFFNFDLFERMLRVLNIPLSIATFEEIIDHSFVKQLDEPKGMYKIHDNFYEYVTNNPNQPKLLIERIFSNAIKYLHESLLDLDFQSISTMYASIIRISALVDRINDETWNSIMGLSIHLLDSGYWSVVNNTLSDLPSPLEKDLHFQFLKAIYFRKTGKLSMSNDMLSQLGEDRTHFGSYGIYVDYYKADVDRVLGNYDAALSIFNNVSNAVSIGSNKKLYLKTQRQIGDLTFVRSGFKEAHTILRKASDLCDQDSMELAEILRIMGHIYRFNFMLEESTSHYIRSLEIAHKSGVISLEGRLYNNLAEVFCWIDQKKANEFGEKSLSINRAIMAPVEEGKTLAALAIAKAFEGNIPEAIGLAKDSESIQARIAYRGGILFANIALGICYAMAGNFSDLTTQTGRVMDIISKLNGEKFSVLPLLFISKNYNEIENLKNTVEWLDFGKTSNFLEELVKNIHTVP